jgi:hypothetical protein
MADFDQRTVTTVRHEYVLKSPTNPTEMNKAMHAAYRDRAAHEHVEIQDVYDDQIVVAARGDEVVVWWEQS